MDILSIFTNILLKNPFLLKKGSRVLIGVSGGSDSTCLVHLFKQAGYDIGLAHCNYHMRGIDSDNDQTFIDELAQ